VRVEDRRMLERAAEYLEGGASALKMRQKLIKVADHYEIGWETAWLILQLMTVVTKKSCGEQIKLPGVILRTESQGMGKGDNVMPPIAKTTRTLGTTLGLVERGICHCQPLDHSCLFLLKDKPDQGCWGCASHVVCLAIWQGHVLLKEDSILCTSLW